MHSQCWLNDLKWLLILLFEKPVNLIFDFVPISLINISLQILVDNKIFLHKSRKNMRAHLFYIIIKIICSWSQKCRQVAFRGIEHMSNVIPKFWNCSEISLIHEYVFGHWMVHHDKLTIITLRDFFFIIYHVLKDALSC